MSRKPSPGQLDFDFMLGVRKQFRVRDAAEILGLSVSFVEKLFDEGRQLSGHEHNGGAGKRQTKTIPREWMAAYLLKTARYDNAMRLQMAREVLDTFQNPADLAELINHLNQRIYETRK